MRQETAFTPASDCGQGQGTTVEIKGNETKENVREGYMVPIQCLQPSKFFKVLC